MQLQDLGELGEMQFAGTIVMIAMVVLVALVTMVSFLLIGRSPSKKESSKVQGMSGSNSVVESQPSKLLVAGSIPVSRSSLW